MADLSGKRLGIWQLDSLKTVKETEKVCEVSRGIFWESLEKLDGGREVWLYPNYMVYIYDTFKNKLKRQTFKYNKRLELHLC